jgi:hypothetical protein
VRARARVCVYERAYVYVFMVELTTVLLLLTLRYARVTRSVLEDRSLICAGQEAILSSSLHYWMVSETPKVLYLIGTVSCLP